MINQINKVGESKVYKLKARANFVYPAIRLPAEYTDLIGKTAKIYELNSNGGKALLLVFGDSFEVLKHLANNQLEKRITQLEQQLNFVYQFLLKGSTLHKELNKKIADPAGFEPATYGLEGLHLSDLRLGNEFCVDYSAVKDEFVAWLYNQVNEKTAKDYIAYLDKYAYGVIIKSQDDLEEILDRIKGGYNHFVKGFRNLLKFLEKKKLINKAFANELREVLKVKRTGVDTFVPNDEQIKAWLSKIDREEYEIVFKLLAFSGLRFNEAIYLLNTFTPKKLHIEGKIAYYDLDWSRNTKRSFKAFMPAEFGKKLRKLNLNRDTVISYFKRRGITPKHLRKWNATKLLKVRVPESIVDFIQGRTSGSVLVQHYLAKLNLAIQFYGEAVDELMKVVPC